MANPSRCLLKLVYLPRCYLGWCTYLDRYLDWDTKPRWYLGWYNYLDGYIGWYTYLQGYLSWCTYPDGWYTKIALVGLDPIFYQDPCLSRNDWQLVPVHDHARRNPDQHRIWHLARPHLPSCKWSSHSYCKRPHFRRPLCKRPRWLFLLLMRRFCEFSLKSCFVLPISSTNLRVV